MAYRVTRQSPATGRIGVPRCRGDRALTRNVLLAGATLSCLALGCAGALIFGHDHDTGSNHGFVSRQTAIRLTYADPVPPPGQRGQPFSVAEYAPAETGIGTALKFALNVAAAPAAGPKAEHPPDAAAPAEIAVRIPLPVARPARTATEPATMAAIPLPRARLAAVDLPRELLFDNEPTGSLGALAYAPPAAATAPRAMALAKPRHKLTPHEKLWGPVKVASLATGNARDLGQGLPRAPYDRQTAIYVIADRKVYLPDGATLEAHSGLREHMDDPDNVHLRMRGATPPHVYELTMREAPFHGVEAIRLNPVGGKSEIFGRDGLLAHTYLLGSRGDSNGCVSFKDYEPFLQAFKSGKIARLVVLAKLD